MSLRTSETAPPPVETIVIPIKASPPPPEDDHGALWPFLWILFWFKAITISATYYFATRSSADISILIATHWFWLGLPIAAMAGPVVFRWRLMKVRRKRATLHAAEWMVDSE